MKRSDTIGKLAEAMAKAQGRIRPAVKNAVNPHLKNRYANLEAVVEAIREPLASNGITVMQESGRLSENSTIRVTTLLAHSSGEWVETETEVPFNKRDAQGIGSAATYGCRYALTHTLGIPTGEGDDDANEASAPAPARKPAAKQQPEPQTKPALTLTLAEIGELIGENLAASALDYLTEKGAVEAGRIADKWAENIRLHPKRFGETVGKWRAAKAAEQQQEEGEE